MMGRSDFGPLLLRSLVAGTAVALVSVLGSFLGPELTGIVVAFPLTLSVSAWLVYKQYGATFAAAMLTATQRTLPSYGVFCIGLHVFASELGGPVAFTIGISGSVVSAGLLAWYGLRVSRARIEQST